MKEAERRQTQGNHRRILRCGARSFGARTLDGVPPRLSPKGIIPSQRLSFRPGFLGLGPNGRYPSSPVPVQGSTSHPGHNAGRHDAQAAREQAANPPAGTALAPMTRCASVSCPSLERGWGCNYNGDLCQGKSDSEFELGKTIVSPATPPFIPNHTCSLAQSTPLVAKDKLTGACLSVKFNIIR